MKLSLTSLLIIAFLLPISLFGQTSGQVEGIIYSESQEPLLGINVSLEGTNEGGYTNPEGRFVIKNVPVGSYALVVSGIGYSVERIDIQVNSQETTRITITLNETSQQLEDVVVSSERYIPYSENITSLGLKQNVERLNNPQSVSVVNQEIINDQVIIDFNQAVRNVTGVVPHYPGTTVQLAQKSRGFEVRPSYRNGYPNLINAPRDVANIEEMVVLRGPSGTLYGTSGGDLNSPGGLVNVVTKKPTDAFFGSAGLTVGSWGLLRSTLDVNTPLNEDKSALFRINTAIEGASSYVDLENTSRVFVAPVLTFRLSPSTELTLDGEFLRNRSTDVQWPSISEWNYVPDELPNLSRSFNPAPSDAFNLTEVATMQGTLNHQINNTWRLNLNFGYGRVARESWIAYTEMASDSLADRYTWARDRVNNTFGTQLNLNGEVNTGSVKHSLLFGADYLHRESDFEKRGQFVYVDQVNVYEAIPAIPDSALNESRNWGRITTSADQFTGFYAQDLISLTDRLTVVLGGRLDYFKQGDNRNITAGSTSEGYDQTAFSPRAGIVFQPIKDMVSVYGNYSTGFTNQGGEDVNGERFDPIEFTQMEAGIKGELWNGRLIPSIAIYEIVGTNILVADQANPGYSIQEGEQTSRGYEVELIANPANGWNILTGYSYNEPEYSKSDFNEGNRPNGLPKTSFNLWTSYRLTSGTLSGLGMGVGLNYVGDVYLMDNNEFSLPEYTIWQGSVYYEQPKYRVSLKVDNITDEIYFQGTYGALRPGMPRRVLMGMQFRF
ncbi:TonB-dependent siderophore receptor [Ekhidna sp.]|uniref:TonB-dependent siderophore receptor n=1 Tax=Ekhidna sp. TaxID=2608089 RepID=UPI003C7DDEA3